MTRDSFTFGSLFAGIGGFDLGLERAGMVCKWQVEIDPFCQKVLQKHWPDVPKYLDVRDVGKHNLETVDLICGGFPCQDLSKSSSTKTGLKGNRSGLWHQFSRITGDLKPGWILVENVGGLLSNNDGRDFATILRDLAESGYDAEWENLPAAAFGAPHLRERIFLVAYSNSGNGKAGMGDFAESSQPKIFTASPAKRHDVWLQTLPSLASLDDGFSSELYRPVVTALGNAVVPQVAEWIGHRIMAVEND